MKMTAEYYDKMKAFIGREINTIINNRLLGPLDLEKLNDFFLQMQSSEYITTIYEKITGEGVPNDFTDGYDYRCIKYGLYDLMVNTISIQFNLKQLREAQIWWLQKDAASKNFLLLGNPPESNLIKPDYYACYVKEKIDNRKKLVDGEDPSGVVFSLVTTPFHGAITLPLYAIKKAFNSIINFLSGNKMLHSAWRLAGIAGFGTLGAILVDMLLPVGGTALRLAIGLGVGSGIGAVFSKYTAKAISSIIYGNELNPTNPEKYQLTENQMAKLKEREFDLKKVLEVIIVIRKAKNDVCSYESLMGSIPLTIERARKNHLNQLLKLVMNGDIIGDTIVIEDNIYCLRRAAQPQRSSTAALLVSQQVASNDNNNNNNNNANAPTPPPYSESAAAAAMSAVTPVLALPAAVAPSAPACDTADQRRPR